MAAALSPVSPASPSSGPDTKPSASAPAKQQQPSKSKPRKRVNTAEKRSQHNAIERARRETLNGKFLSLACLLPQLASQRRPSKSAIVNSSITHVGYQREQRLLAARILRRLCAENDALVAEVNEYRKSYGQAPRVAPPAFNEEVDEICAVEKEQFGTFASMGGEGGDDDDDLGNDFSYDAPMPSYSGNTSLITPRGSTDMDGMHSASTYPAQLQRALTAPSAPTAAVNGLSWSEAFNASVHNHNHNAPAPHVAPPLPSMPFTAFMSDAGTMDSSSGSPANSHQGFVLTPPTTSGLEAYTHTPSPASSGHPGSLSISADKDAHANAHGRAQSVPQIPQHPTSAWTPQQLLFLQHQQAQLHAQAHAHQSQSQAQRPAPVHSASFSGISGGHGHPTQPDHAFQHFMSAMSMVSPSLHKDGADYLAHVGAMAPPHGQGQGQGGDRPSLEQLSQAVRMGIGMGMSGMWGGNEQGVDGF